MIFNFDRVVPYIPFILNGIPIIIILSLGAAFFGCIIGLCAAFAKRRGGVIGGIFAAYIDFFRGTPAYVQLCFFHLALPQLIHMNWPGWLSCIIVFFPYCMSQNSRICCFMHSDTSPPFKYTYAHSTIFSMAV